jgi:hypothetical protein
MLFHILKKVWEDTYQGYLREEARVVKGAEQGLYVNELDAEVFYAILFREDLL